MPCSGISSPKEWASPEKETKERSGPAWDRPPQKSSALPAKAVSFGSRRSVASRAFSVTADHVSRSSEAITLIVPS